MRAALPFLLFAVGCGARAGSPPPPAPVSNTTAPAERTERVDGIVVWNGPLAESPRVTGPLAGNLEECRRRAVWAEALIATGIDGVCEVDVPHG